MRFESESFFFILRFYRTNLHTGTTLDAIVISKNQFASIVDVQSTGWADISTGKATFNALKATNMIRLGGKE